MLYTYVRKIVESRLARLKQNEIDAIEAVQALSQAVEQCARKRLATISGHNVEYTSLTDSIDAACLMLQKISIGLMEAASHQGSDMLLSIESLPSIDDSTCLNVGYVPWSPSAANQQLPVPAEDKFALGESVPTSKTESPVVTTLRNKIKALKSGQSAEDFSDNMLSKSMERLNAQAQEFTPSISPALTSSSKISTNIRVDAPVFVPRKSSIKEIEDNDVGCGAAKSDDAKVQSVSNGETSEVPKRKSSLQPEVPPSTSLPRTQSSVSVSDSPTPTMGDSEKQISANSLPLANPADSTTLPDETVQSSNVSLLGQKSSENSEEESQNDSSDQMLTDEVKKEKTVQDQQAATRIEATGSSGSLTPVRPISFDSIELNSSRRNSWSQRETSGEVPRGMKRQRIPPLWNYVYVHLSWVEQSGRLYIQMDDDSKKINQVLEELNQDESADTSDITIDEISVGGIVAAPYEGDYFRAKVTAVHSADAIDLYFIDYGNIDTVQLKDIRRLKGERSVKLCQLAIPCELSPDIPKERFLSKIPTQMYLCFGDSYTKDDTIIYIIVDVASDGPYNVLDLPLTKPLDVSTSVHVECGEGNDSLKSIKISHAQDPHNIWTIKQEDILKRNEIEKHLRNLPLNSCSPDFAKESLCVVFQRKRAIITGAKDERVTVRLLDYGQTISDVPISRCRLPSIHCFLLPPLAQHVVVANANPPVEGWPSVIDNIMTQLTATRHYRMRLKPGSVNEVFLADSETGKLLSNELRKLCVTSN